MKSTPEPIDGAEAWAAFDNIVAAVLRVPRAEIERREAEYKRQPLD